MAEKSYAKRLTPSGNSFKDAFSSAKKAGKKEFTWKGKDYTTGTADEAKAEEKRYSNRERARVGDTSKQLTDKGAAFKLANKTFGANYDYTHKGKKFKSDMKGDKPRREGYDTFVMAKKGGLIKGKPKLAKRGWK
tara:strand:+ start:106 stop:510 length:405 start_codon:yes stop_codon:yes gene_type:complete